MITRLRRLRLRLFLIPVVLGVALVLGMTSASAAAPRVEEFGPIPNPLGTPCEIEFDRGGALWIEQIAANSLGRFDPSTGQFTETPLPTPGAIPGGMEQGPDGGIWFPEVVGNQIVRLDPATRTMREFPLPWAGALAGKYGASASDDLTFGDDGAAYFTLIGLSAIGRLDIRTGRFSKIPISPGAVTAIIQRGPHSTIIAAETARNQMMVLDEKTQTVKEYPLPKQLAGPQGVTTGSDGAVWFTEALGQRLGRLDIDTGKISEVDLLAKRGGQPLPVSPGNPLPVPTTMKTGGDGKLYFTEGGLLFPSLGNKIGIYDIRSGTLQEVRTPSPGSTPCDLNTQHKNEVWFGELVANKVGRIKIGN